ncbi:MAG: antibiotic biosynthesis monooxygenase [Pirellulaceae bacterium]|nr:antibiotic biosynthesis monooxygenase [Pirellulaceae bacterium]
MIVVVATIYITPEKMESFTKAFQELVPLVVAEEGCLEYFPVRNKPTSLAAQRDADEGTLTVIEKWESLEALERHLKAPHMEAFRKEQADALGDLKVQIYEAF